MAVTLAVRPLRSIRDQGAFDDAVAQSGNGTAQHPQCGRHSGRLDGLPLGADGARHETGELIAGGIREHSRHTLELYRTILTDIGLSLDHVVKVNAYLADPADFAAWNEVYLEIFDAPYPCRTTVTAPPVFGLIEVELIASLEPRR